MLDPVTLYHGMQGERPEDFGFHDLASYPEGLHLGTLAQARMRAGGGSVLEVRLRLDRLGRAPARVRDRDGSWRSFLKRRARAGDRVLVYLNRHEGLDAGDVEAICEAGIPAPPALDPSLVEIVRQIAPPSCRAA